MKAIKRTAIFLIFLVAVGSVCGCYKTKPGTMDKLKGTYKLTQYTRTDSGSSDAVDLMELNEIEAYLVVEGTDFGYTVYKDVDTELVCNRVHFDFTYSDEDSDKIKKVEYSAANGDESSLATYASLGFDSGNYTLNASFPHYRYENNKLVKKYDLYTEFTRVDSATDLSYIEAQVGTIPAFADYALAAYDGLLVLTNDRSVSPYIYYLIDIDAVAKKATVYYALQEDEEQHILSDVSVSYKLADDGVNAKTVTVGDKEYDAYDSELRITEYDTPLFYSLTVDVDAETFILQALADYAGNP